MQQPNDQRRRRGAQSRQAIIEAAIACIATRGLCNTTLERVAERAQVSRALVVFHFKSKSRMLVDVLNYLSTEYSTGWDAVLARPGATPSETILHLLEYDVGFASERPDYLSVWNAFWGEATARRDYQRVCGSREVAEERLVVGAFAEIARRGGYAHLDATALGLAFYHLLSSLPEELLQRPRTSRLPQERWYRRRRSQVRRARVRSSPPRRTRFTPA